jgi:hypothetical protein
MSHLYVILPTREDRPMISICCTPPKAYYKDLADEERKKFCRLVYLLRKRGYSVLDAQKVAYQKVLQESIPFNQVC